MTSYLRRQPPLAAVLALLIAGLIAGTLAIPAPVRAHEADGYPARIHEGSCQELGRVTNRLTGVDASVSPEGTPVPAPEVVGSGDAVPIDLSATKLDVKMADLIDSPHAIVVYESDEAMDQMLVCGNVGGAMMMQMPGMAIPGDELVIWLVPQADSSATGVALLRSEVGGTSTITIVLGENLAGGAISAAEQGHEATPEATPNAG